MAEYKAHNGTRSFEPDNTPDKLYIETASLFTMGDLIARAEQHFGPDIDPESLSIDAEHIHTRCLGYDQYDGSDWDDYIILTREG